MAWHGTVRPGLLLLLLSFVVISETMAKIDSPNFPASPFPEQESTYQKSPLSSSCPEGENIHENLVTASESGGSAVPIENSGSELYRYETAYACEGKTLKIECKDGELIKLIRANYGRFSITICNDHGNTDWSVNCMSPKSLRVLHGRCTHNQNCSIPASTSMFGDPCVGTHKYLEAHYQCVPATTTTTTNRPSPPWLLTSQPPMWSTVKPSARPPPPPPKVVTQTPAAAKSSVTTSSQHHHHQAASSSSSPSSSSTFSSRPADDNDNNSNHGPDGDDILLNYDVPQMPDEITTLPFTTSTSRQLNPAETTPNVPPSVPSWARDSDLTDHCAPTTVRSINWNWTRVNSNDIQPCPGGTTGYARWRCVDLKAVPTWHPTTPDLSQCRSVWLTSLEQRIIAGRDTLISITNDLAQVTSSKTLYGGDMMITTKMIQNMAQKMSQDLPSIPDTRQREAIVTDMLKDVVRTGSNLLDSAQHPSWRDLSYKEQMRVATSLLIGLEENAFLLADAVTREKTVDQVVKNIMLSVRVLEAKSVTTEVFPSDSKWSANNDSIELSQGALQENSDGGLIRLVFVAFDRLEEILQWQPESSDGNNNNMNSNDNVSRNVTRMLNSKVISASLGKGRHIQLREPVRLTLKHLQTENVSNPSCVFWDYTTNAWLEEGCRVDFTNQSHTVCLCDHLTNFAILMDVHAIYLPVPHQIALKIITYVGCIISIVCLILAIVTFQLFRGLKGDRTTIHSNLCICLLIAELIFLIGICQTDSKIICGVIAGFLHYFFLCAFIWMFFEGFQLYVMLIEVFEAEKSRVKWYYMFAYGLPLLIVAISAGLYPQGYGTSQHCWLKTENYFIYTFVGPVVVVLTLNLIFLALAVVMMCQHANSSVSLKNKDQSRLASASGKEENALQTKNQANLSWLQGAIVLVFLLGLTWTFGLLYLNKESVAMAYMFAILNSLQGFFIFLFHCVQNEKVRKEYRKFVRQQSWLPKCLRCSKPGSSAATSSGTSGPNKERRTSVYGSNGNQSGGTNSHSTDNSVLTPHATSLHQREWNSRSCSNVNRIGTSGCRTPVAPTCTSATTAATLCRPMRDGTRTPPPAFDNSNNTSTLPYIRNFYKNNCNNLQNNLINLPKSASTWGPLHKPLHWKSISFKSYSRDSGHGGSEQEDSPRSHPQTTAATACDGRLNKHAKDGRRQAYVSAGPDCTSQINNAIIQYPEYNSGRRHEQIIPQHPKHLPLPQTLHQKKKNKPNWNHHTYTEIFDGRSPRGLPGEDDPVYEEIERGEVQVSDMSDEDGRRQSDMSRQSSRSYGDHRPLIPYSPGETAAKRLMEAEAYRMRQQGAYRGGDSARSLAAVLDGETVVCHLEPPEMYHPSYAGRSLVLPPYSES